MSAAVAVASESAPADWTFNTPVGLLQKSYSRRRFLSGKEVRHGHYTYASVAMLSKSIAEEHAHFVWQDLVLLPLDLSMIKR